MMPIRCSLLLTGFVVLVLGVGVAQETVPLYKQAAVPVDRRVADLVSKMTVEEKFWQLFMCPGDFAPRTEQNYLHGIFGLQVRDREVKRHAADQMLDYGDTAGAREAAVRINAIQKFFVEKTRLGIPIIPFDEALHGLVRADATSYPESIGLAATWDDSLMINIGTAVADEARSRGVRDLLCPVINIARDVRWGRVEETYGEDPYLCARLATAFVRSIERHGVIATPKHMIANSGDGGRDSYPIDFDERLLDEEDFVPFLACIRDGGVQSVMTSYNSLNGEPCTANPWLLKTVLKRRWGFSGFVISDASAVGGLLDLHHVVHTREESAKLAIESGLDVIFQSDYAHSVPLLKAFTGGMVDTTAINDAVARVLTAKFKLGLFEHPYVDPDEAARENGSPAHRALALQAARESMVLLKNDRHVLPLPKSIRSLAVIGVDATEARLGGYSGPGIDKISILDGIRKELGSSVEIRYAPGCGRLDTTVVPIPQSVLSTDEGAAGVNAQYYNTIDLSGTVVLKRVDPQVNFKWTLFAPDPKIHADWFSVRWEGNLRSRGSVVRHIGVAGDDGYRLYVDGNLVLDRWNGQGYGTTLVPMEFTKGTSYPVRLEFKACVDNVECRLVWDDGIPDHREAMEEAVRVAGKCDAAVVVAGLEEGEFRDRAKIGLPGEQSEMIRAIAATGTPVVVVIVGGSAVTMDSWIDHVPGVIDAWYPGEAGGQAVAEVLFGDVSPGGKLPITFPRYVGQLPLTYNHKPTGRGDDYYDMTGKPAFPFGFGLSYATFSYDSLRVVPAEISPEGSASIRFVVKNTGSVAGDEVAQLYVRDLVSSTVTPVRALKGFRRVHLLPGESAAIALTLSSAQLSILDANLHRVVEPGEFRIMVGSSSRDIRLRGSLRVAGER